MQDPPASKSSRRNRARAAPSPLDSEVLHGIRAVQTAVNLNQTLGEALDDLRARSIDSPAIYVYVVDDDDRLVGQVPTRALLFSPPSTRVRDVLRADLVTIPLDTSFDDALAIFGRTKLLALPVVDAEGRLVGALDVERYASETLARSERDRVRQVFQTLGLAVDARDPLTPAESFRMRVPWLFCNIGGGIDRLDQRAPHATAAYGRKGIEILEIADVLDLPAMPVKEVMGQACGRAINFGDQAIVIMGIVAQKPLATAGVTDWLEMDGGRWRAHKELTD